MSHNPAGMNVEDMAPGVVTKVPIRTSDAFEVVVIVVWAPETMVVARVPV
jgi:hypothetical protein